MYSSQINTGHLNIFHQHRSIWLDNIIPLKLFVARYISVSIVKLPISRGMFPLNLFTDNPSTWSSLHLDKYFVGICPLSWLSERESHSNLGRCLQKFTGRLSDKLFSERSILVNEDMLNKIMDGIDPESWLPLNSNLLKLERFPTSCGICSCKKL